MTSQPIQWHCHSLSSIVNHIWPNFESFLMLNIQPVIIPTPNSAQLTRTIFQHSFLHSFRFLQSQPAKLAPSHEKPTPRRQKCWLNTTNCCSLWQFCIYFLYKLNTKSNFSLAHDLFWTWFKTLSHISNCFTIARTLNKFVSFTFCANTTE